MTVKGALEISRLQKRDPWVLSPQSQPLLQWWDLGTMLALVFVALVTPAEVALLETRVDALFFINRLIDVMFMCDMGLQFCVAYRVKTPYGSRLETRRRIIARHYLTTWFLVDVLSVLPYDTLGILVSIEALERAKMMKVLRLLRLVKLLRVLRASRVFYRWETSMALNYNTLKLFFAFALFILACHWLACIWAMLGYQGGEGTQGTWVAHAAPSEEGVPGEPLEVYIAALYWSVMTVTAVGYGDIVPVTTTERVACALLMFGAGFVWAYALGETMTALNYSNFHEESFRQTLDDLNHMMADRGLPGSLRRRLRSFFFQIKDLARVQGYRKLVEQLSPSLQAELAISVNEVWLHRVWYFNSASLPMPPNFLPALATQLQVSVHAQQESIGDPWTLYILHRGLAVRRMEILSSGSPWGEDFLLSCRELLDTSQAFCLTFVELSRLTRRRFSEILKQFPQAWSPVRGAVVRTALRRGILVAAARKQMTSPKTRFMAFAASKTHRHDSSAAAAAAGSAEFPLPSLNEESQSVREKLHDLSQKQAQMQLQLDATRSALVGQLSRIEGQLKLLLPHGVDGPA